MRIRHIYIYKIIFQSLFAIRVIFLFAVTFFLFDLHNDAALLDGLKFGAG
jgi:hypothetical protein